jgi:hypothetical protein
MSVSAKEIFDPNTDVTIIERSVRFIDGLDRYMRGIEYMVERSEYETHFVRDDKEAWIRVSFGTFTEQTASQVVIPEIQKIIKDVEASDFLSVNLEGDTVIVKYSFKFVDCYGLALFMPMDSGRQYPFSSMVAPLARIRSYLNPSE